VLPGIELRSLALNLIPQLCKVVNYVDFLISVAFEHLSAITLALRFYVLVV
jgi:hypothetical protein